MVSTKKQNQKKIYQRGHEFPTFYNKKRNVIGIYVQLQFIGSKTFILKGVHNWSKYIVEAPDSIN
jgi:hypothetical protein